MSVPGRKMTLTQATMLVAGNMIGTGVFLLPVNLASVGGISIFGWVGMARLVRSQVLALRETEYIVAARAAGASTRRVLFQHLLPNVSNLLIVAVTLSLGAVAVAEVGLSFLGIGIQERPTFGLMIEEGRGLQNIRANPHIIAVPAFFIVALVLSFNLLGDQLTDILSPRRR